MTLSLTADQSQALRRGEAVRLVSSDLGEVVILQASAYEALSEEQERAAWKEVSGKALARWGRENPYDV